MDFTDLKNEPGDPWGADWNEAMDRLTAVTGALQGAAVTSSTEVTIGTGIKTFTTDQTAVQVPLVGLVRAYSLADPDNYMIGLLSSFTGNSLSVNVSMTGGAGSATDWVIGIQFALSTAGDVSGPAVSVDNALPRFDGTGGKTLQAGQWIEADSGDMTAGGGLNMNAETLNVAGGEIDASGALISLDGGDLDASAGHISAWTVTGKETAYVATTDSTVSVAAGKGQALAYTGDDDGIVDLAPAASGTYYSVLIRWINETGGRDLTLRFNGATTNMFQDINGEVAAVSTDFTADGADVQRLIGVTVFNTHAIAMIGSPYTPA